MFCISQKDGHKGLHSHLHMYVHASMVQDFSFTNTCIFIILKIDGNCKFETQAPVGQVAASLSGVGLILSE